MSQKNLQIRLIELLHRLRGYPMTAEVASIHLEVTEEAAQEALEALFVSSQVECARERGEYRIVRRENRSWS